MKRYISCAAAVVLAAILSGCSASVKSIMTKSEGKRDDVFREIAGTDTIPSGYADVIIKASIKTHLEGYYIGELKDSAHGKASYPFLVNIDGQEELWNAPGLRDSKPSYDASGTTSTDPEARDGMKYTLEKKVRLAAGSHKVRFGVPEDDYFLEAEITVQNGETTILEYKPVYRYKTGPIRIPTFLRGISHYDLYLNGNKFDLKI